MTKDYKYAQVAYNAYFVSSGGKSLVSGHDLPVFEALSDDIQNAWYAAADAVYKFVPTTTACAA